MKERWLWWDESQERIPSIPKVTYKAVLSQCHEN